MRVACLHRASAPGVKTSLRARGFEHRATWASRRDQDRACAVQRPVRTEARAIGQLNHRNVCTLYDVGPDYLVIRRAARSVNQKCGLLRRDREVPCERGPTRRIGSNQADGAYLRERVAKPS